MGQNPRYVAYCAAHGHPNDPLGMEAADRIRWPGGFMAGFITWNSEQWEAWAKQRGGMPVIKSAAHHAEYDAWLLARFAA